MHVYGCNSELDVEKVDLPAREVAELGINLLRLDLCDPDPLVLTVKGQKLRFSRMRQFEFAYPLPDNTHVLGMHVAGGRRCVQGPQELDEGMIPTMMGFIFGRVCERAREKEEIKQRLIDAEGFCIHCANQLFDERYLCSS